MNRTHRRVVLVALISMATGAPLLAAESSSAPPSETAQRAGERRSPAEQLAALKAQRAELQQAYVNDRRDREGRRQRALQETVEKIETTKRKIHAIESKPYQSPLDRVTLKNLREELQVLQHQALKLQETPFPPPPDLSTIDRQIAELSKQTDDQRSASPNQQP